MQEDIKKEEALVKGQVQCWKIEEIGLTEVTNVEIFKIAANTVRMATMISKLPLGMALKEDFF